MKIKILVFFLMNLVKISVLYSQADINFYMVTQGNLFKTDLNSKYEIVNNENIDITHIQQIKPEIGISYKSKFNKSIVIGGGVSHKELDYGYILNINAEPFDKRTPNQIVKNRNFKVSLVGVNATIGKLISSNTTLFISIEYNYPYSFKKNIEHNTNYTFYSSERYGVDSHGNKVLLSASHIELKEQIITINDPFYTYLIPEIKFETRIKNKLSINYGAKLKFWSFNDLYSVKVNGYYTLDKNNTELFYSRVNNKFVYIYFGIAYSLNFNNSNFVKE